MRGFAGGHLAEYLLTLGHQVIGTTFHLDNTDYISHILDKVETLNCDITQPSAFDNIIKKTNPDFIFHLAGQSFVPLSWSNPQKTFEINVFGVLNLLESVKKYAPRAKTLIIGSGDEYGNIKKDISITETSPLDPQTPYGIAKISADLLSRQLGDFHNLKVIVARPFPHIGPRQSPDFVVSAFSRQIALIENQKKEPVLNVGNLDSNRDFTDVRDTVRAYWLLLDKGQSGDAYNICSQKTWKIQDILNKLLSLSNTKIEVKTDPSKIRLIDIHIKKGSNKKIKEHTGWQPEIPIEKTLEDTLCWWRKNIL